MVWLIALIITAFGRHLCQSNARGPTCPWVGDHTVASGRVGMGTVMGVMNTSGISSAFVAPLVSGWISDMSGSLSRAFYVGAFSQIGGILVALTVHSTVHSRQAVTVDSTSTITRGPAAHPAVPSE